MDTTFESDGSNQVLEYSEKMRWFEIVVVGVTGLGKFIFMDWLNWRFAYISIACTFWLLYVIFRYRKNNKILEYWGFSISNFKKTFLFLLPMGIVALVSFLIIGEVLGTNILSWHILPLLLLYPIWGTIQQFLMVGLIAGNLREIKSMKIPKGIIILITATLFSVVHFPHIILVFGTFLLALVYSIVYLKIKNLYVLGLFHGWLGAFFFYTVLERDPFMEVFGLLFQ